MALFRTIFSRLSSKRFFAGLLSGILLGAGGFYLYAQVRVQMGGSEPPEQELYLSPIELPDSTAMTVQGTVPEDWSLQRLDGAEEATFATLRGRPTLLTVGATWCEPCTAELSTLQALHDTTGTDVHVAFVSAEPSDSLRQYVEERGYSVPTYVVDDFPSVLDGDTLPRTYLIRSGGQVVYRHVGPADWSAEVVHHLLDRVRSMTTASRSSGSLRRTSTQQNASHEASGAR